MHVLDFIYINQFQSHSPYIGQCAGFKTSPSSKQHCVPLTSPSRSGMFWKCCGSDPGRAQSWDGQPSNARDCCRAVGSHVKLFELWDCLQCQGMSKSLWGWFDPISVHSWGLAIVAITCIARALMDPTWMPFPMDTTRFNREHVAEKTYLQLCGCQEPNYNYIF